MELNYTRGRSGYASAARKPTGSSRGEASESGKGLQGLGKGLLKARDVWEIHEANRVETNNVN